MTTKIDKDKLLEIACTYLESLTINPQNQTEHEDKLVTILLETAEVSQKETQKDYDGLVDYMKRMRDACEQAGTGAPNEEAKLRCVHTASVLSTILQKAEARTEW